jgi:carbonic anhydrase/acetyltransferase-like protein (isoleucine patch superfamily)
MGPAIRSWGQKTFKDGNAMMGASGHIDKMQPSLRCVAMANGTFPKSLDADWIAPNAVLVGDVSMGDGSSAWHGSVLRGDTAKITVGKNTVLQDNTRVASNNDAAEVNIGDNVFVGANAKLDGCTLKSYSYVGMGASVA